jgi:hypothetical protein
MRFFQIRWPRVGLPGGVLRGWPGAGGAPGVRRKVLAGRPVAPSRAPQGHPQEILAQLLGGRGPLGLPGGPNGPKNGFTLSFEALRHVRGTRSRQDEPMEVGEVGSKRPSLECNGVHVVGFIISSLNWHPVASELARMLMRSNAPL